MRFCAADMCRRSPNGGRPPLVLCSRRRSPSDTPAACAANAPPALIDPCASTGRSLREQAAIRLRSRAWDRERNTNLGCKAHGFCRLSPPLSSFISQTCAFLKLALLNLPLGGTLSPRHNVPLPAHARDRTLVNSVTRSSGVRDRATRSAWRRERTRTQHYRTNRSPTPDLSSD